MNKEQMIRELKDRIAWLHTEASEATNKAKKNVDEANFYLNIINLLEKKVEGSKQ